MVGLLCIWNALEIEIQTNISNHSLLNLLFGKATGIVHGQVSVCAVLILLTNIDLPYQQFANKDKSVNYYPDYYKKLHIRKLNIVQTLCSCHITLHTVSQYLMLSQGSFVHFVEFLMFSLWIVKHFTVLMWQPHTHGKPNGWMCKIRLDMVKTWLALNWMNKMANSCILHNTICQKAQLKVSWYFENKPIYDVLTFDTDSKAGFIKW